MSDFKTLMSLKGRVAAVTGGAGHLGSTMLNALAEAGADVVVIDVKDEYIAPVAAQLKEKWGCRVMGIAVDLEDSDAAAKVPEKIVAEMGRLDILVNNAAFVGTSGLTGWNEPFERQSVETWKRALTVNLTAIFALTQAAAPYLRASGHGSIVNVASIYGIVGPDFRLYEGLHMSNPAAYAASKGGVVQFTRWSSTVLAPEIRVNAITPGGIFRNQDPKFVGRYESRTPMKRMAREEDFIGAVVYLASDLSQYVTGQNLVVDGGFSVW
ncbi:MAG: SDR family oxidoreductase [Lentisphaeria bacterium]|nr:SDR family oxidoreductase [Lentisphaeria bacterium]